MNFECGNIFFMKPRYTGSLEVCEIVKITMKILELSGLNITRTNLVDYYCY